MSDISPKAVGLFIGVTGALTIGAFACDMYNKQKERQLKDKKLENERLYFSKLTPEMVQDIELKKIQLEREKVDLKKTEEELKKTITNFKRDIQSEIQQTTNENIERDMRKTFDKWSANFEDRVDKKLDRMTTRIDDLSDKYGGVKTTGTPSINVVNAPNN